MVVISRLQRTNQQNWKKFQLSAVLIFSFLCLCWIWMNSFLFCFIFCVSCSTIFKTHSLSVWDFILSRHSRILTCRELLFRQHDSIYQPGQLHNYFRWDLFMVCFKGLPLSFRRARGTSRFNILGLMYPNLSNLIKYPIIILPWALKRSASKYFWFHICWSSDITLIKTWGRL